MSKRIVSIDVGIKYIGVATTDPFWNFPVIIGALNRKQSIQDDLERLKEMLKEIDVAGFVLGFPITMDNKEGSLTPVIKGFERRMKEIYPKIPFFKVDESFSSVEAMELKNINNKNYRKLKKTGVIDSTSAAIILQRFLQTKEFDALKKECCQ